MQSVSIQTAQNVNIRYEAASVGDRIVSFLLDAIIRILYAVGVTELFSQLGIDLSTAALLILFLPAALYYLWMEIFFNGQSIGKMALGMKVVMLDGGQPSIGAYMIRFLLRVVDITLFSGGVAVIVIAISGKGQRLGDIAANTTVVKLQANMRVKKHELLKKMPQNHETTFNNVTDLTDKDIAVIMEALALYRKTANKAPVEAVEEKVKKLLNIETDLNTLKFLHTVVRDYNYLTSEFE